MTPDDFIEALPGVWFLDKHPFHLRVEQRAGPAFLYWTGTERVADGSSCWCRDAMETAIWLAQHRAGLNPPPRVTLPAGERKESDTPKEKIEIMEYEVPGGGTKYEVILDGVLPKSLYIADDREEAEMFVEARAANRKRRDDSMRREVRGLKVN